MRPALLYIDTQFVVGKAPVGSGGEAPRSRRHMLNFQLRRADVGGRGDMVHVPLGTPLHRRLACTHKEGEVYYDEHRSGADGTADDGRAPSTSIVVAVFSATSTSTRRSDHTASTAVSGAANFQVRHRHWAHHSVVHHRFRSRGTQQKRKWSHSWSLDRWRQTKSVESLACLHIIIIIKIISVA